MGTALTGNNASHKSEGRGVTPAKKVSPLLTPSATAIMLGAALARTNLHARLLLLLNLLQLVVALLVGVAGVSKHSPAPLQALEHQACLPCCAGAALSLFRALLLLMRQPRQLLPCCC